MKTSKNTNDKQYQYKKASPATFLNNNKKISNKKKKSFDTETAIAFYIWHHCTRKGANVWQNYPQCNTLSLTRERRKEDGKKRGNTKGGKCGLGRGCLKSRVTDRELQGGAGTDGEDSLNRKCRIT